VLPGCAQVIHNDMSLYNVLLDDDLRVCGIVDFGDMTHAALVCDLAVWSPMPTPCRRHRAAGR
jgi:Ser/Thr protein kinase RdoA (MazF antagonist)